jgi:hypothetical protein
VVLHLLAHVAAVAVLVPDLHAVDVLLVGPTISMLWNHCCVDVPGRRQHHDPAVLAARQVVLDAAVAERQQDLVLDRLVALAALADEVAAVVLAQPKALAAQAESPSARKSPLTAAAAGGLAILLCRPRFQRSSCDG